MDINEFKKNYLSSAQTLEHSELSAKLSMKFFKELLRFFPEIKVFNNPQDLTLLKYGAMLHDIGVMFEKNKKNPPKPHHKIGRDLILENKISGLDEAQNLVVANIVRYHRKSLPDENQHKCYKMLSKNDRKKTDVFASIVRLIDAFDYNHFNMVDDFSLDFDRNQRILTIDLGVNIMLNIGQGAALSKKKQFLEKVFDIEVLFN